MAKEGFLNGYVNNSEVNSKLICSRAYNDIHSLTIRDFAKICIFRFGNIKNFARKIGVSRNRANQILIGYKVPIKTQSIQKIADALLINPIVLTQLFDKIRREKDDN